MAQYGWPEVNRVVREQLGNILARSRDLLGDQLIGLYLHGSLAMSCFSPSRSDLDLLAVTARKMSVVEKRNMVMLLLENSNRPSPVEISFLPVSYLDPWEHPTRFDLHFGEDHRERLGEALQSDLWQDWNEVVLRDEDLAAHVTVTRERGISLYGPSPLDVFPPVPEPDFLNSVLADVLSPVFGLNANTQIPEYMIFNACRTLAYLHTKKILSKDEGGVWAFENMLDRYHSVVRSALDAYRGDIGDHEFPPEELSDFVTEMRAEIVRLTS